MIKLKEIIGKDLPPPYQHLEDENSELEMALKFDPNGVKMKLDFTNKKITKQGVLTS